MELLFNCLRHRCRRLYRAAPSSDVRFSREDVFASWPHPAPPP